MKWCWSILYGQLWTKPRALSQFRHYSTDHLHRLPHSLEYPENNRSNTMKLTSLMWGAHVQCVLSMGAWAASCSMSFNRQYSNSFCPTWKSPWMKHSQIRHPSFLVNAIKKVCFFLYVSLLECLHPFPKLNDWWFRKSGKLTHQFE